MPAAVTVIQANKLVNKVVGAALAKRVDGVISVRSDCFRKIPRRKARTWTCDTLAVGATTNCEASSTIKDKKVRWTPARARCWVPGAPADPFGDDEGPGVDY